MLRTPLIILALLLGPALAAQVDRPFVESRNGWRLSPHGTIRVLLVFVEVEYADPARNADPGTERWRKGELPVWKDDVFDPFPLPVPQATVSRYYHDISLGNFQVLGDYIDTIVTIRESELGPHRNGHATGQMAVRALNALGGGLRTRHGLSPADFDRWKRGGRAGMPKEPGPDEPHSYDHIMFISRNGALRPNTGSTDGGSPGPLYGHESDTQSRFGSGGGLPFEILKHEFNHLLIGGNNFHSGGGNAAAFTSYFMSMQGGWSMMGAASSSLLTCSAWDRDRMGWAPPGANHRIRARDMQGRETNADLDPIAGDTGTFVLRDLVTTGDALRIRMPFIPDDRHPQWLWVENHQGHQRNGSPTDRFHWEFSDPCTAPIEPGLFMVMQVDRENRSGPGIDGGHADYLRPVPANGNWDLRLRGDTLRGACPFSGRSIAFHMDDAMANPLTGNHEQELPLHDRNGDGSLSRSEHWVPGTRVRNGTEQAQGVLFGRPEHAFRMAGNRKLGMGTNPSSANMLTLVCNDTRDFHGGRAPNVRAVHLNGIAVELLEMRPDGDAVVRVRNDDTVLEQDVRWCADSIVLHPLRGPDGRSLTVAPRRTLLLDRSRTPTRMHRPDTADGRIWFTSPTRFMVMPGAHLALERKARLELRAGSEVHLLPGATLTLARKARIKARNGRLVVHAGVRLDVPAKVRRQLRKAGALVEGPQ